MEDKELLPRLRDLAARCDNKSIPAASSFLTPHEQAEAAEYAMKQLPVQPVFFGGYEDAERRIALFLPEHMSLDCFDASPFIRAVHASAPFSKLTHRDYLGSLMGLGIERQCVGDITVKGEDCWFFLTPAITRHVLDSLVKVGRGGVSLEEIPLGAVPSFELDMSELTFTVQSLRADAVVAGSFRVSRSSCRELFLRGDVSINHFPCTDLDAPVGEGDLISLRHHGRARVLSAEGQSKKGRTFVTVGIYK